MNWSIFLSAIGLFCVFEGILPFLSPLIWRRAMFQMLHQSDRVLRITAFISMLLGLALVTIARNYYSIM